MDSFERDVFEIIGAPVSASVGSAYEGASRLSREAAMWTPSVMTADWDILESKETGDARARDLVRNDGYTGAGVTVHKDSIVGAAFLLNARPDYTVLGLDEVWATEFQEEVEAKFTLAAESPRCLLDAKGTKTLTDMVRLAVGLDVMCGEVLMTAEWRPDGGYPFSTAVQMIEIARLSTPYMAVDNRYLRGGVDRDANGRPKGYYIRVAHPYDNYVFEDNFARSTMWKYVAAQKPWGRPMVLHLFEEIEANQSRGVNALMAALTESRMVRQFRGVQLQNAIVNASFAATIESELPTNIVYEMLGAKGGSEALASYASAYLGVLGAYADGAKNMRIDGVKIPHMLPGSKLNMQPAGTNGQAIGSDFESSLNRYLAANLGLSAAEYSRDYAGLNYSTLRGAMAQTYRGMQSRKKRTADRTAAFVYGLWLEEMLNTRGAITAMPRNPPNFYEGLNREAYCVSEWIGASRGQIDELKETQAAVLRLKYNLTTHEDEMARLGKDWRSVIKQRKRENAMFEAAGLYRPDEGMAEIPEGSAPEANADDA